MTNPDLNEYVQRILAEAPPLSEAKLATLITIFESVVNDD